ncbi:hypothetical protein [Paenibacillus sp. BR1-192]|uniref:hypothetical protein n=1 Tax=Paenibacillus sp. BR1-192 TaxID=3032287 RepID=UPI00240D3955|nr:hypothetical protein [Paenibacillus sp. BR1-192]WFB59688.1 hypothetical protein P0X86_05485 [Paenibacillus sp. BR1-192]
MELPFESLKYKFGLAGAREKFESICVELIQNIYEEDSHTVESAGGDGGIDIFVGNYDGDLDVYQCKYFIDKIDSNQKKQIIDSFNKVVSEKGNNIMKWHLCVAKDFNKKEHEWWANWKKEMEENHNFKIKLCDASQLTTKLKKNGLFDRYFSHDKTKKEELSNDFRYAISTLSENSVCYELDFLDHLDELSNKWQADRFIINQKSPIFSYLNSLRMIVSINSGMLMNNEEARDRVTELIELIIDEYKKLIKD